MRPHLLLAIVYGAFANGSVCQASSPNLRNFSLNVSALHPPHSDAKMMVNSRCTLGPRHAQDRDYFLRRPDSDNIVGLLRVRPTSLPELNPPGADYGLIPPLAKLTKEEADELWGSDETRNTDSAKNRASYRLRTIDGDCTLNLKFAHGKLAAYGIKTDIHGVANIWQSLRK